MSGAGSSSGTQPRSRGYYVSTRTPSRSPRREQQAPDGDAVEGQPGLFQYSDESLETQLTEIVAILSAPLPSSSGGAAAAAPGHAGAPTAATAPRGDMAAAQATGGGGVRNVAAKAAPRRGPSAAPGSVAPFKRPAIGAAIGAPRARPSSGPMDEDTGRPFRLGTPGHRAIGARASAPGLQQPPAPSCCEPAGAGRRGRRGRH